MCLKTSAVSRLHLELYLALEHMEPLKLESLIMIVSLLSFVDSFQFYNWVLVISLFLSQLWSLDSFREFKQCVRMKLC